MSIIMNAMRLLDEGRIDILGPADEGGLSDPDQPGLQKLPLIKGGFPDYSDIVDEEHYSDGQPIFMEGKFGRWVYVILDGHADLVKEAPAKEARLLRLGQGTYPGTILFFSDEKGRSTSLLASGEVHLGVLNLERLHSEFSSISPEFRSLASGMALRLKKLTDTAAGYYHEEEISTLDFSQLEPLTLPGMDNDQVMMIKSGKGYLVVDQGEQLVPLAEMEPGDVIGDLSFLDSALKLNGACVFGDTGIELAKPDMRKLTEEYYKSSATLAAMFKNLVVRTIVVSMLACRYYDRMMASARMENN